MKIDGKQIANEILEDLKKRINKLRKKSTTPNLAIIIIGSDPSSEAYVKQKELKAKIVGIKTTILRLPSETSQAILTEKIQQLNSDSDIQGIIVQQPVPAHIELDKITNSINPEKDVDGFHSRSHFQMPIAMAVLKILENVYINTPRIQSRFVEWLKDKNIVIIGKGKTGGKPIIHMFERMKIPFALIDSKTNSPEILTKKADIIISTVGKANVLKSQAIKRGVALISIGISRGESARLMGDYDQNEIKNIASFYTPTPGGVGPINVAMLLKNLIIAAEKE
ncbi:MAG: bifunctional 5,10-methylenetetrahydrofolate dehydrogenase/5,10-methenyltetrahydrofolate cyclohydrolase [Candidatus Levybacteria bacterium]|nr:bifunctional 5,10-methylenetetrahydrofolate dehydrogenase/5,10-methenyltetrahydrofolate cyclohydrolase [Candidatus Levybacteria bacterium]